MRFIATKLLSKLLGLEEFENLLKTKHSAGDVSFLVVEIVIAHSAPHSVVIDFQSSFVG